MTDTPDTPTPSAPKKKPLYTRPKFIISLIAAVIFLILIFQNWAPIPVSMFFVTDKQVPAALLYIGFSLIGFIVGWLVKRPKSTPKDT